jgi:sirohydrochlorin ferrochelatase
MRALIVFAHGSTVEDANEGVRSVTRSVSARSSYDAAETAFLDCAHPDLTEAVDALVGRGATEVTVVPFFLTLGIHLQRDLPALVDRLRSAHPGLRIHVTAPLEGHPALTQIVLQRATGEAG